MIESDRVRATFEQGVLVLKTIFQAQRILPSDLEEFWAAYRKAERELAKRASDARAEHERLLHEISRRLDLPVGAVEED